MNITDRRAKRSKKLLAQALIELSSQKSYDQITIRDIVDKADVAYSTFFQHYHDKDSLLRELAADTIASITQVISEIPESSPYKVGLQIFQHVLNNEALYCIFLNDQSTNRVFEEIKADLYRLMFVYISDKLKNSDLPAEIIINHILSAICSLIKWWLDNDKPYSIEKMAQIYEVLIIRATNLAMLNFSRGNLAETPLALFNSHY
jgi:AcrR family transcriptional regulator